MNINGTEMIFFDVEIHREVVAKLNDRQEIIREAIQQTYHEDKEELDSKGLLGVEVTEMGFDIATGNTTITLVFHDGEEPSYRVNQEE
jgi:hypothetical protein